MNYIKLEDIKSGEIIYLSCFGQANFAFWADEEDFIDRNNDLMLLTVVSVTKQNERRLLIETLERGKLAVTFGSGQITLGLNLA